MTRDRAKLALLMTVIWLVPGCGSVQLYEEGYEPPYPEAPAHHR